MVSVLGTLETLEQRVKYVRKNLLDMTQEEFANLLGVTRDVVSRYETGKTRLPAKQALKIIKHAHISADWLLSGEGDVPTPGKQNSVLPGNNIDYRIDKLERNLTNLHKMLSKSLPKELSQGLEIEAPSHLGDIKKVVHPKVTMIIETLIKLEINFKNVLANPPIGGFIIQDGKIKNIDNGIASILGYDPKNLINKTLWDLIYPDDLKLVKETISRRLRGEVFPPTKFRICKANKEIVTIETYGFPGEYEGHSALWSKFTVLDEFNELEQNLKKLKKLLYDEFIKTG